MSCHSYLFAKRKLAEAAKCLQSAPSHHEGLADAFTQSLRWIDLDRDLPPYIGQRARDLLAGFPVDLDSHFGSGEFPARDVTAAISTLSRVEARSLANRIVMLSETLNLYTADGAASKLQRLPPIERDISPIHKGNKSTKEERVSEHHGVESDQSYADSAH